MKCMNEWNVSVVGAGTMGLSIAQHFATKGLKTILYNRSGDNLSKAYEIIKNNLEAMASLDALSSNTTIEKVLNNLTLTTDLKKSVKDSDIIFECVSENAELKKYIFGEIDLYASKNAYICSDTSALNIYEIINTSRPDKYLITHFFNPAHVMPLVEIVKGKNTTDQTAHAVKDFLTAMGKKPIIISKPIPGFIFNRLLTALEREACYIVEQGIASCDEIDTVITTTFGPRFVFEGIFELLDHVGLDTEAAVVGDLIPELCQSLEAPSVLLKKAAAGEYG